MTNRIFTAVVYKEEDLYVAQCPEVGTARVKRLRKLLPTCGKQPSCILKMLLCPTMGGPC